MKSLLPSEFFDSNWRSELKEIAVPCFVPSLCINCGSSEMTLKRGPNHIAVVNQHGRFDLQSASFYCGGCNSSFEAGLDDYIYSGIQSHSRYKDEVIRSDKDVRNHKEKIEEKVARSKSKEMCGGSVFKAARSDSSKFAKSDETGMVMAPCRHDVGEAFPEYQSMAQMKVFLPRMHAKAHNWPCQVLYSPHWVFKMGATMGEEHEQVFSKMARYGNSTKHMSATMTTYDKYKIVDTWMLWWRYQEEIIQAKLEILNYLNSLKASRLSLEEQSLLDLEAAENTQFADNKRMRDFYRGKGLIANTERERLSA
ncbi:hypothetical protein OUZ56_017466 [Daphnia magna]|uniref:CxC3 like cysteine cluster domain-containing protein n=1 Tax=Daphnia magna TaxID=35525 RepID=A0ABR0ASW4_9CRUS|nr:hypothetical protein OUZ56_017466 [Daphnia magna]